MRRVLPNPESNSAPEQPIPNTDPLVHFDADSNKCSICFMPNERLISPCKCSMRYHQLCLLRYIREKILAMRNQIDFSIFKCKQCKTQIKFKYYESTEYSCTHFCNTLKTNWCNKSLIVLIFLTAAIIAVGVILSKHKPSEGKVYYGLLIGQTLLCLVFLAFLFLFVQLNLCYIEITLAKVFEYVEHMRNNSSNSDEDSPNPNIASKRFEIIIDEDS